MGNKDILIVEDESDIRELITDILKEEGFNPRTTSNSTEAFELINERVPTAVILDIWLQGSDLDGLGILEIIKKRYPLMPVLVISGHGTIQTAVTAIKLGAFDYLEKPFTQDKLLIVLKRACESSKLKRENIDLKLKVIGKTDIVGVSQAVNKLKQQIEKIAPTSGRVMIRGRVGSGKELTARCIHKKSKYSNGPFIVFSPSGMSLDRIEQDLLGEPEKHDSVGAFTRRSSVFEAANNGSIYIDEVGDLPLSIQGKLLKIIQNETLERVSGSSIKLNLRIITSSSKDLKKEVALGNFREDLYYRLNVIPLEVPSLEEHKDDIPLLITHFIHQLVKASGLRYREFSDDAIATLQTYNWPGNVRELKNVVEWTMIMNPMQKEEDKIIKSDMLPSSVSSTSVSVGPTTTNTSDIMLLPLREAREIFEKQYLSAQMSRFNNNISKTSAFVGMERSALHRKLKLLNIHSMIKKDSDVEDIFPESC